MANSFKSLALLRVIPTTILRTGIGKEIYQSSDISCYTSSDKCSDSFILHLLLKRLRFSWHIFCHGMFACILISWRGISIWHVLEHLHLTWMITCSYGMHPENGVTKASLPHLGCKCEVRICSPHESSQAAKRLTIPNSTIFSTGTEKRRQTTNQTCGHNQMCSDTYCCACCHSAWKEAQKHCASIVSLCLRSKTKVFAVVFWKMRQNLFLLRVPAT